MPPAETVPPRLLQLHLRVSRGRRSLSLEGTGATVHHLTRDEGTDSSRVWKVSGLVDKRQADGERGLQVTVTDPEGPHQL